MALHKTLILVSSERSVQYRERSDRMAHSILRLNSDDWFVECAIRSLRSRYCTVGMLLFVQTISHFSLLIFDFRSSGNDKWSMENDQWEMVLHKNSNLGQFWAISTVPRAKRPDGTLDITSKFWWLVRWVCHPVASLAVLYSWHVTFRANPWEI